MEKLRGKVAWKNFALYTRKVAFKPKRKAKSGHYMAII